MSPGPSPGMGAAGSPLAALRRISTQRPQPPVGERCEMCAQSIGEEHQHVVDLSTRSLMCTCRGCYLLFTDHTAELRFRAVPDRYLSFPDFRLTAADWDTLQIPVGLVFCFRNSTEDRMVSFYPGPAGATESELPLADWNAVIDGNPGFALLLPDVEALLLRRTDEGTFDAFLVPIDTCYELVGTMRQTWRGFDGGQEARAALDAFFVRIMKRSKPAQPSLPVVGGAE